MKPVKPILLTFAVAAVAGVFAAGSAQLRTTADLVIRNAKVVTIDKAHPRAEALAIQGDRIVAVTTDQAIAQYIQPGRTQVIDARRRLVIPGFNDAHAHFAGLDPDYIDLRYITDPKVITERVAARVRRRRPGA